MFDIHEADGKWFGIFQSFGIDVGDGRHTKCPLCASKDNFRCDNKDGRGTWVCTCGAGDGWKMLQLKLGITFKQAVAEVKKIIGTIEEKPTPQEPKITPEILRNVFLRSEAISGDCFVSAYLKSRGLSTFPPVLRKIIKCYDSETMKEHPAMLAVVTSHEDIALTMHRTFLTIEGSKASMEKPKKLMPGLDKLNGSAIRLFDHKDGQIGIAEGIETAIACSEMFHIPTWAAVSAVLLENFIPPKGITEVFVFGDNDANFAGQKAAYTLANRLIIRDKIKATVLIPEKRGHDWLDELNRQNNG